MKIIHPFFILETNIDNDKILTQIETAGRTAYKSESQITNTSSKGFVKMLIEKDHLSVIEHYSITVRIICDRGVSHEIVRHRIASYTQESTRFCNYSKGKYGKEITVIKPCFWEENDPKFLIWKDTIAKIENSYMRLIELGASPQEARSILPNSLKTEIVITMNLREWMHFFRLRTSEAAHPQMKEIAVPLLNKFKELMPELFENINS